MKKYQGVFPALVTPYDEQGNISAAMVEKLVNRLIDAGISGLYVGGSTGESYLLSMEDRKYMLEAVLDAAAGRVPVIANIGVVATKHSCYLAEHAEAHGAAVISAVPPIYFPFTKEEVLCYYEDIANATSLPVLVYNIPAMSGVHFTKQDLERLLDNDKVIGMKHTSYDLFQLQQLIEQYPQKSIFIGHDELYLSALSIGAKAGIGSSFNIMPEKFVKMHQLFEAGKMEEALRLQGDINGVIEALVKVGVFKGIKEILRLQGYDSGDCRKPFLPLSQEEKQLVLECAKAHQLL